MPPGAELCEGQEGAPSHSGRPSPMPGESTISRPVSEGEKPDGGRLGRECGSTVGALAGGFHCGYFTELAKGNTELL